MFTPRVVVAGHSGGAGKTVVSLGLIRAFVRQGLTVCPFKKGPDYIDAAWLGLAANRAASSLDLFFLDAQELRRRFIMRSHGSDVAVIEGNRGFFDGKDLQGSTSTAEVAGIIEAPVVLVLDITKMTRTTAAVAAGCKNFPGGERIAGVVLNRAGGARHAAIAKKSVEELAGVPVFGVLPRLAEPPIFERYAGLTAANNHENAEKALDATAALLEDNVDIAAILACSRTAPPLPERDRTASLAATPPNVRIGVARDAALWKYYDENLEALRDAGAELVFVSLLSAEIWPKLDGLYLGGGDIVPFAARLAADHARKSDLKVRIESGMPVYSEECGFFYLGETLEQNGVVHPMCGLFPIRVSLKSKPARLGYVEVETTETSPFYPAGLSFKGHEYHYAAITFGGKTPVASLRKTAGGRRIEDPDGLVYKNAFGSSMQIYAPAVPLWARSFVAAARRLAETS